LKHIVAKMQADTVQAIETWSSASNNLITAVQVDSQRINNLVTAINRTERTTQIILRTLMREQQLSRTVINLTHVALKQTVSYIERLIDIAHLQSSLNQLLSGRLNHDLVPAHMLNTALNNLRTYLLTNQKQLRIIFDHPQYYYQAARTVISRSENTVIIMVHVPLTFIQFQGQLTLYEISNFPLLVPRDNQSTIISLDHCAVLYNSRADIYVPFTTSDIVPSSPVIDIAATDLNLQTKSRQHCLIAVLEGTDHNIHEFCKFRVIDSLPEPAVLRLSPIRRRKFSLLEFRLSPSHATASPEKSKLRKFKLSIQYLAVVFSKPPTNSLLISTMNATILVDQISHFL